MDDRIKRWTAKRKTALVVEIIQRKTTAAMESHAYDLSRLEIEGRVKDAKRAMGFEGAVVPDGAAQVPKMALWANPLEIRGQCKKTLRDQKEAFGEAILELRARVKLAALMERGEPLFATGPRALASGQ